MHLHVDNKRWRPDIESAAYLVTCGALTIAAKHAGPCTVHAVIQKMEGNLEVDIADDGPGIENLHAGTALPAIRDRAEAMNGRLHITSSTATGTRVIAELPCA